MHFGTLWDTPKLLLAACFLTLQQLLVWQGQQLAGSQEQQLAWTAARSLPGAAAGGLAGAVAGALAGPAARLAPIDRGQRMQRL